MDKTKFTDKRLNSEETDKLTNVNNNEDRDYEVKFIGEDPEIIQGGKGSYARLAQWLKNHGLMVPDPLPK